MKPVLARYLGVLHGQSILADAGLSSPVALEPHSLDLPEQVARIGRELVPAWKELGCR